MPEDNLCHGSATGPRIPGTTFGPYELVSILGAGRSGEVWKARDRKLDRNVAIRIGTHGLTAQATRAIEALAHPNICALLEMGTDFVVMELVEGKTLAERIEPGPLDPRSTLAIAKQLTDGLAAAHLAGICHGDLKSGHIRIRTDGVAKLMDFGMGREEDAEQAASTATLTTTMPVAFVGGVSYRPPEQVRGAPIDSRADIWAFGVILYEMVTGRKPLLSGVHASFEDDAEVKRAPTPIQRLLRACLTVNPEQRLRDLGTIDWSNAQEPDATEPVSTRQTWGPFVLIERVGRGGFGEVYRAHDPKLDREVAVKLLRTPAGGESDYTAILREARLIAKVRHPNVVSVYGVERYDGRVGFWSDFVNGKTLSDLLRLQGPFGARETAAIGIELCRAVSAMHAAGLLHRDIKASNVMREQGGRILLMDFGLSSEVAGGGVAGGTPPYMAPELFRGLPPTIATDIYAMGVLLFFLTTGRYPADSMRTPSTRRRLIDERPDLPEAFVRTVETAIDVEPAKRFSSAGEMLAALANTVGTSEALPPPSGRKTTWTRGRLALAGLLLALVAGIAYQIVASRHKAAIGMPGPMGANQNYAAAEALLQREDKPDNIANAVTLYGKAIDDDPKFALAHSGLARAYLLRNKITHSAEFLEQASTEGQRALELDGSLAPVHVTMGMIYTVMSRYDLAANELQQALRLDETSAESHAALAKLHAAQGRNDDVVQNYLKAIDLGPDDWRWPNQLGVYYLSTGHYSEAVGQFRRVVLITPDNIFGFINLGISYRRQERFSEAETALKQALKLNPRYPLSLTTYGNLLMIEGKYVEAAQIYGQAADLAPGDYMIRANLASAYQWSDGMRDKARAEYLAAIAMAEKLREVQPRDPALLASLGAYYSAVGNEAKAIPLLRQALALSPDDPNILVRVGEGFELIGHRSEAIVSIRKALDLGYSARYVERSPELVNLRKDPKFLARNTQVR